MENKKLKLIKEREFNLNEVSTQQLIDELRNRGLVVSGRLAGVKY